MSLNIEDLGNLPDEELIRLHDSAAKNTDVGVSYYLDELKRRQESKQIQKLLKATEGMLEVNSEQYERIQQMLTFNERLVKLSEEQSEQSNQMLNHTIATTKYSKFMFILTIVVTVATIINLVIAILIFLKTT